MFDREKSIGIGILLCCLILARVSAAGPLQSAPADGSPGIETEWGGHLKLTGAVSRPDAASHLEPGEKDAFYDGGVDFRVKNKIFLSDWGYFETHYEAIAGGGDMRRQANSVQLRHPELSGGHFFPAAPADDDRRLLDLTKIIHENDSSFVYHRLDRFSLTLQPHWGTLRIGRQALTWGNGLLFNPMDLFNPFSPTDVERDYKVGDDMATLHCPLKSGGNFQVLYVPRRNPSNHRMESGRSSLAGKLHLAAGTTELDFMVARHYEDAVVGLGGTGYIKDAAWRLDTLYTFLDDRDRRDGFFSLVANMDLSWVWLKKNFYGLLEFYYNGLGDENRGRSLTDPDVLERLARRETYTLGRTYLGGEMQIELHPLLNVYMTAINNIKDPSGIIQPRFTWDALENLRFTCGANLYYGAAGTEFGGFQIPWSTRTYQPADNFFLWSTLFF